MNPFNGRRFARWHLVLPWLVLPLVACQPTGSIPTTLIDDRADRSAIGMGLDSRDFDDAAAKNVQDLLASGAIDHPNGGRYVLVISRVTNDTMQRIDTDQLIKRIRVALLRSGKVVVTTGIGLDGAEDPMVLKSRQLRASKEVNQTNVAARGQMLAPELSLSGRILQQNVRLGDGSQRVGYEFHLALTDLRTGVAPWENFVPINKRGPNEIVSW